MNKKHPALIIASLVLVMSLCYANISNAAALYYGAIDFPFVMASDAEIGQSSINTQRVSFGRRFSKYASVEISYYVPGGSADFEKSSGSGSEIMISDLVYVRKQGQLDGLYSAQLCLFSPTARSFGVYSKFGFANLAFSGTRTVIDQFSFNETRTTTPFSDSVSGFTYSVGMKIGASHLSAFTLDYTWFPGLSELSDRPLSVTAFSIGFNYRIY